MTTGTQVAKTGSPNGNGVPAQPNEGGAISAFASEGNFVSAQRMAKALQASTLTPTEYRGNISNVLIAMELASRIGCSVLMVMQNMAPIKGKPAWSSTFLIASVNASGRFTALRFRFQGEEGTDSWGCRAVAKDKDTDEECVGALITIAMAKSEGWYQKKGSKWQTVPEQMLMYRSATFWTRVYCPEIAMGIRPVDELEDMSIGSPAPSSAAVELEEALRAASVPVVEGVPVEDSPSEDDDGSPPSDGQQAQLSEVVEKARGLDLLRSDDEEGIQAAIDQQDGAAVRQWIRVINKLLLQHAAGDQGELEVAT